MKRLGSEKRGNSLDHIADNQPSHTVGDDLDISAVLGVIVPDVPTQHTCDVLNRLIIRSHGCVAVTH